MERRSHHRKEHFCETNKCILVFLSFVVLAIAVICTITFVDVNVREKQQYRTDDLKWWQKTIVYQVYPRSFQDSDGDGTGDLQGLIQRLDYFTYLGIGAIWLSPFYKSPMKDFGYDVQNYTEIDPIFGDMNDFEKLVEKAKEKGIKIVIDFVPNHTSNKNVWFEQSRRADDIYKDYYVWRDCGRICFPSGTIETVPPNNWLSHFGGSAWTWDDLRQQCYYHAYLDSQPDLNHRDNNVKQELKNVLRFWLDKGVSGFRVDAIISLFEANDTSQDEAGLLPYRWKSSDSHNLTMNFPEIFPVLREWMEIMDQYENKDGESKYVVTEAFRISDALRNEYYAAGTVPFNFNLLTNVKKDCGGRCIKNVIEKSLANLGDYWPNFVIGNHDSARVASRLGVELVNIVNMLLLTLPGTPTVYYGEEIGMVNTQYTLAETKDPKGLNYPDQYERFSRDPERSPMQWDNSSNAGFSVGQPWLHVNPNYKTLNVQAQRTSSKMTTIKIFKRLSELRKSPSFNNNKMTFSTVNDDVISYVRTAKGRAKYLVIMNFGHSVSTVDCSSVGDSGLVELSSENFKNGDHDVGKQINMNEITLDRGQGLVLKVKK